MHVSPLTQEPEFELALTVQGYLTFNFDKQN